MEKQDISRHKCIRVAAVAETLGVRVSTVYLWMDQGILPSVRMGRCRRVLESDLNDFIENGRENSE